MRGLRSFLLLLVVALALGAYLYFVESKRDPAATPTRRTRSSPSRPTRSTSSPSSRSPASARRSRRPGPTGRSWRPSATQPDSAAVSGMTSNLSSLEMQRVIDENPPDLAEYGLTQPRIEVTFKAGGKEQRLLIGRKTPAGDRPLRQARRSEARLPDSVLRRHDVQQDDLRPARQDGPQGRSRQDRRARDHVAEAHAAVRQGRRRMEADAPIKARADFTRRRRAGEPAEHAADEVDRRAPRPATSPSTASTSPRRRSSSARARRRRRSSSARRRRGRRLREGSVAADGRHDRVDAPGRRSRRTSANTARRTSSTPAPSTPPGSRSTRNGADGGVREDEDEEQGRPGRREVEADRADGRGCRSDQRSTT